MQDRASPTSGAYSVLSPGPGPVTSRARLGALLLSGLVLCGAASLFWKTRQPSSPTCSLYRHGSHMDFCRSQLSPERRAELLAEMEMMKRDWWRYQAMIHAGEKPLDYDLTYMRLEVQLTDCEYARTMLQKQIKQHEEYLRNAPAEVLGAGE